MTSIEARSERLDRVATDRGHFAVLAIDHVRSFATTVRPDDPDSLASEELWLTKRWLIEGMGFHAGAVLVDPGFLTAMSPGWVDTLGGTGLILGIEDGDYEDVVARPRLLPGWDVERAVALGVDAVKISVYFDPRTGSEAAEQFVAEVVAQCASNDMPLFCEPLALYSMSAERREAVIEGVRRFGPLGADVLKLQFPGSVDTDSRQVWAEACVEIDRLSPVPWTILSEGSDYGLFRDQLRMACRAGGSGFLAARPQAMAMAMVIAFMSSIMIFAYMKLSRRYIRS